MFSTCRNAVAAGLSLLLATIVLTGCREEKLYEATARFQRRSDTLPETAPDDTQKAYKGIREMMAYNFTGRPAIEQLIKDLNLDQGSRYPRMDDGELTADGRREYNKLVASLQSAITIAVEVDTRCIELIAVTVRLDDRELVAKIANKLVENYLRNVRKELDDSLLEQKKFFDNEASRYNRKVQELEQQKLRFMLKEGGIEPDDPLRVHNRLAELKAQQEAYVESMSRAKASLEALVKWEKEQPERVEAPTKDAAPELDQLRELQSALKEVYVVLVGEDGLDAGHPAAKHLHEKIKAVEARIARLNEKDAPDKLTVPNAAKAAAQRDIAERAAELKAMEEHLEKLNESIARYEALNRNFFVVRNEYLKLTRELEDAREQLKFWTGELRRTQLALTFAVSERGMRLSIIQRAMEPDERK